MKLSKEIQELIVKIVAFATAFTILYEFVKDLGEIAIHIYQWFCIVLSNCLFCVIPLRRRK